MQKLRSHWTDFSEIWYLRIFFLNLSRNSSCIKSDKNNVYFTWSSVHIFYNICISSTENEKCLKKKPCREKKNSVFNNLFFFENCALCEIMLKNIVQPARLHDNTVRAHCIVGTKVYRHTSRMCDSYCLSTATVGCTNTPECYVISTLPVLFLILKKMWQQVRYMAHRFPFKLDEPYTTEQSPGEDHIF